jgi:uncharacterized lipoprotein YmbA
MSRPVAVLLALAAAAAAAGCIHLGGSEPPLEKRSFDIQPSLPGPVPPDADGAEVLWVEPFGVDPALDRPEMVWRRGVAEAGAWERYLWARPPADAVRAVLADALVRSGACAVVATEPRAPRPDYSLRGHLERFEEVDGATAWSGALEIRVVLLRLSDGEEILRRVYARNEPASARNPGAVVEALKAGLASAASELAADVKEVLEAERDAPPKTPAPKAPAPKAPAPKAPAPRK